VAAGRHPPDRGHLRAGVGGRDGNQGQAGAGHCLAQTGCGPAADGDDTVGPHLLGVGDHRFGQLDGNVAANTVDPPGQTVVEQAHQLVGYRSCRTGGDQDDLRQPQPVELLSQAAAGAEAEHHPAGHALIGEAGRRPRRRHWATLFEGLPSECLLDRPPGPVMPF
jgi:hypothetical protein